MAVWKSSERYRESKRKRSCISKFPFFVKIGDSQQVLIRSQALKHHTSFSRAKKFGFPDETWSGYHGRQSVGEQVNDDHHRSEVIFACVFMMVLLRDPVLYHQSDQRGEWEVDRRTSEIWIAS